MRRTRFRTWNSFLSSSEDGFTSGLEQARQLPARGLAAARFLQKKVVYRWLLIIPDLPEASAPLGVSALPSCFHFRRLIEEYVRALSGDGPQIPRVLQGPKPFHSGQCDE